MVTQYIMFTAFLLTGLWAASNVLSMAAIWLSWSLNQQKYVFIYFRPSLLNDEWSEYETGSVNPFDKET